MIMVERAEEESTTRRWGGGLGGRGETSTAAAVQTARTIRAGGAEDMNFFLNKRMNLVIIACGGRRVSAEVVDEFEQVCGPGTGQIYENNVAL